MFRRIPPRPTRRTRFPAQKKDEDRARGREEGMQLLAQVALMLLDEERYADLKRLGDEAFRNQAIEEYEKKKEQEKTGTSEPR